MFNKSKEIQRLKNEKNMLLDRNNACAEMNAQLIRKNERQQMKIKELMNSVQALNRDLDSWEELSNLISSIEFETEHQTVPRKGIELIKYAQKC